MGYMLIAGLLFSIWVSWICAVRGYSPVSRSRWDDVLRCDFRRSSCSWLVDDQSHYDKLIWQLTKTPSQDDTGPSTDHTSESTSPEESGNYLYIDTKNFKNRDSVAVLRSPAISTRSQDACLSFWYYMHGYDVGRLDVWKYNRKRAERIKLFSAFGPLGPRWFQANVPVGSGDDFILSLSATYSGSRGLGNIAVDDISFSEHGPCPDEPENKPSFDCDFNRDVCSWHRIGPWIRDVYNSNVVLTLKYDNRLSTARPAYLRGPTISALKDGACLGFSYRVDFSPRNDLTVAQYPYGGSLTGDRLPLLVLRERHYNWRHVYVSVAKGENFYIAFTATSGGVSIDNITMSYNGPCVSQREDAVQRLNYSCDFDQGDTCQFGQRRLPGVGRWKVHRGVTPTRGTGPEGDHTTGEANYLYMDALTVNMAQLYSPIVTIPEAGACLTFWYYMFGEDVNYLTVWRYKHMEFVEARRKVVLSTFRGNQGERWIQHNVTIPSGEDVAAVMEAARGDFPRGDIGIDDVYLNLEGPCEFETSDNPSRPSTDSPDPDQTTVEPTTTTTTEPTTTTIPPPFPIPTPAIQVTGQIDPAITGTPVTLTCGYQVSGGTYEWHFGNASTRFPGTNFWGHQIYLGQVSPNDVNSYRCRVWLEDYHGEYSEPVVIGRVVDVYYPKPEMNAHGVLDPAAIGSKIMLTCGDRQEGVEYNWTFTGPDTTFISVSKSRFLVLESVDNEHNGSFSCSVGKDGHDSAMSDPISINVVRGKACLDSADCHGNAYTGACLKSRCECVSPAMLTDTGCVGNTGRPPMPMVRVVPRKRLYDAGDTVQFSCRTRKRITESATFEFQKDGQVLARDKGTELFNVHTVKNVSQDDNGRYTCNVRYNTVSSLPSRPANIRVKDVPNLNCNFDRDTCGWYQKERKYMRGFVLNAGSYIEVNQSATREAGLAMLHSPWLPAPGTGVCLTFVYRTQGTQPFSLSVRVYSKHTTSSTPVGTVVWERMGLASPRADWTMADVDITTSDTFSVAFEAQGNVAMDAIRLSHQGKCGRIRP